MSAIELCRTAALGGHVEQCDACGHQRIAYNSCRNRALSRSASRSPARNGSNTGRPSCCPRSSISMSSLRCPSRSRRSPTRTRRVLYDILFRTSAETLRTIAADPKHLGAEIGFITVLHTWGQNLQHHPHVHCVVPGGGIAPDGEHWIACRPGFFLPVRVLSRLFRRLFLEQLRHAFDTGALRFYGQLEPLADTQAFAAFLAPAAQAEWVVYAKPPFGDARHVLDYLGRYTHRVAISNNRLVSFDDGHVTFRWKDYKHHAATQDHDARGRRIHPPLPAACAARRLQAHSQLRAAGQSPPRQPGSPPAAGCSASCLPRTNHPDPTEDYRDRYQRLTGRSLRDCPVCGNGHMVCIETFLPGALPRAPPHIHHGH